MTPALQSLLAQRIPIDSLPTPITPCHPYSKNDAIRVDLKRDDLIGDLQTGTKVRALSYILWKAIEDGVTDLITIGDTSSNQCRLVAMLGAQHGMTTHLFLRTPVHPLEEDDNLEIMKLFGARLQFLTDAEWRLHGLAVKRQMMRTRKAGGRALFIPFGCGGLPGALGIIDLVGEIMSQNDDTFPYTDVVVPAGSGSTLFALDLGLQLLADAASPKLWGASVAQETVTLLRHIDQLWAQPGLADALGSAAISTCERRPQLTIEDRWRELSPSELMDELRRVVATLGILPDPLYVLRAFLTLNQLISDGQLTQDSRVLLLVTGACRTLSSTRQHQMESLHAMP